MSIYYSCINQELNLQNGFITQEEFDSMMANIDVYATIVK